MKTRVVHVIKGLGRGGAEMLLLETLKLHNQDLFEFYFIYYYSKKSSLVSELQKAGGKVICLERNSTIALLFSLGKTFRTLNRIKPKLIHAHMPVTGFVARIIGKILRIPVVYTEHYNLNKYGFFTVYLNRLNYNWNNTVIAVSYEAAMAIKQTSQFKGSLKTILNAVNSDYFDRSKVRFSPDSRLSELIKDKIVICTIAVFRKQKQLDIWIKIAGRILSINKNYVFILIGDGSEMDSLKLLVKNLDLDQSVLFTGLVTNTREYLSLANIYLMTSHFEGLPVALLEAMSMSCAPIVTPVGGITDLIDNKSNGYFIDDTNIEGSAKKIVDFGSNRSQMKIVGENARRTITQDYSMHRMVNEIEDVYSQVLKNGD